MRARPLAGLGLILLTLALGGWVSGGKQPSYVTKTFFQQGRLPTTDYAGCADTYIRPGSASADTGKNYGSSDTLKISAPSATTVGENRTLIKFDLTSIPDTATVVMARLWLYQKSPDAALTVAANDSSAIVADRLFDSWTEGVGTEASPTAPPHATACWTRRKGQQGPKWKGAGAKAYTTTNGGFGQWYPGTSATVRDSAAIPAAYIGADTLFDQEHASLNIGADVPTSSMSRTYPKAGSSGARRLGWVIIPCTQQVGLWVSGANANNGWVLHLPYQSTQVTCFSFYSSHSTRVLNSTSGYCFRPMLEVWYVTGKSATTTGTSGGTRNGAPISGEIGAHN